MSRENSEFESDRKKNSSRTSQLDYDDYSHHNQDQDRYDEPENHKNSDSNSDDQENLVPPEDEFWEKYSPHYEFPISSVTSIFLHVLAGTLVIVCIFVLMNFGKKEPVPTREVIVLGTSDGGGDGTSGSGGGVPEENANTMDDPMDTNPIQLEENQKTDIVTDWVPKSENAQEIIKKVAESPNFDKLRKVNNDLRKKMMEGISGKVGGGNNPNGKGTTGDEGSGSTGNGDANTTGERSLRWTLSFKTENGRDYVNQLAAMGAKIIIPMPPKGNELKIIPDLQFPSKMQNVSAITEMHFIDDRRESVSSLCRALGLDFVPAYIIALFPKSVEEELAKKEIAYRGRNPADIGSTTFKILVRNGNYSITVTDQELKKRNRGK